MEVKERQKIERAIVRQIIKSALALGYYIRLNDGEETHSPVQTLSAILAACFSVDEETLIFYAGPAENPIRVGVVFLVYGNDGYDVICDYTANKRMEDILNNAAISAEKYERKYG